MNLIKKLSEQEIVNQPDIQKMVKQQISCQNSPSHLLVDER